MGSNPESAIVRRFSGLNMENILLLQAEIVDLEMQYRQIARLNDNSMGSERSVYSQDWYTLSTASNAEGCEQWKLALTIREKLKEYNEAVLQYQQLTILPNPYSKILQSFLEWNNRRSIESAYLRGRDRNTWEDGKDLTTLKPPATDTLFIRPLRRFLPYYYRPFGKYHLDNDEATELGANTVIYHTPKVIKTATLTGTVIASLLPIMAIAVLYAVHSMEKRLGLVAVFTTLFPISLWFLAGGGIAEVFAATSAFAAVQVAFIGMNTLSSVTTPSVVPGP